MPGVKEVRVNTKKNIVAADAASPEWAERLLATSEIIWMPMIARLPADRSQSSGVVQGVDGNYADDDLLANASSEQRGRQANAKKRGCDKPPSLQKEALHSASNEENKNLRLLRVVADLLPPDSQQLRSICLQAGGAPLPSSKHG
ncbi:hypothetical protein MTO96_040296 [Rhipicephalus appendiculatus]